MNKKCIENKKTQVRKFMCVHINQYWLHCDAERKKKKTTWLVHILTLQVSLPQPWSICYSCGEEGACLWTSFYKTVANRFENKLKHFKIYSPSCQKFVWRSFVQMYVQIHIKDENKSCVFAIPFAAPNPIALAGLVGWLVSWL